MSIYSLSPLCQQHNPSKVNEFLSGFFSCDSRKYVIISSKNKTLKIREEQKTNSTRQTALKVFLCITGIVPLIAAIFKLIEIARYSRHTILFEKNEINPLQTQIQSKITTPPLTLSNSLINNEKVDLINQPMTREELAVRLPTVKTISINKKAALNEYIWLPDLLKTHTEVELDIIEDGEETQIILEKDKMSAVGIYAAKNQNFALWLFKAYSEAAQGTENVAQIKAGYLEVILTWSQYFKNPNRGVDNAFIDFLIPALDQTLNDDDLQNRLASLEKLFTLVLYQANPAQLLKLMESCKVNKTLSKLFLEQISSENLKVIKENYKIPDNAVEMHKDNPEAFLRKTICQLLIQSNICRTANSWLNSYPIFEIITLTIPTFTKEQLQSKIHLNANPTNYFISIQGMEDLIFSLSLNDIENVLNQNLTKEEKIKACQYHLKFIEKLEITPDYISYGSYLAGLDLPEKNIEVVLLSLNPAGVISYLKTILEEENEELIKKAFKCFFANKPKITQTFPGTLPLLFENIDSVEKALAIYQMAPNKDEMKKHLLEGITVGNVTYKTPQIVGLQEALENSV